MTPNDPVFLALIAAFVATIGALPAIIGAVAMLRQGRKVEVKAEEIKSDLKVVHDLTNSTLSKTEKSLELATRALEVANEKNAGLERLVASLGETPSHTPSLPDPTNGEKKKEK